jgi:uncharacterized FlaG/YvyC family protein
MGQLNGTVLRAVSLPDTNATTRPEERARTQAIIAAVDLLNRTGVAGSGREVTYSKDSATKQRIVQIVDQQTKEVLVQWPSDYALQLAQEIQKEHPGNESLF